MAVYKNISSKMIIRKVFRDLRPTGDEWIDDAIEWMGEALEHIGAASQLCQKQCVLTIKDHKACLPGDLYFINRGTSLTPPFNQYKKIYDEIKIEPEEGILYLWDGGLAHRVSESESNEDRISVSFNFDFMDLGQQLKEQE